MSLKTFKPFENYRLNNGNLEIQLDPLTNKLLIENKLKGTKYFINTITGEHNLTMDYKIIYERVDNLKEYVIAADKTLQDQINDIIDEIGTIDGTLPEHNKKIEKLVMAIYSLSFIFYGLPKDSFSFSLSGVIAVTKISLPSFQRI